MVYSLVFVPFLHFSFVFWKCYEWPFWDITWAMRYSTVSSGTWWRVGLYNFGLCDKVTPRAWPYLAWPYKPDRLCTYQKYRHRLYDRYAWRHGIMCGVIWCQLMAQSWCQLMARSHSRMKYWVGYKRNRFVMMRRFCKYTDMPIPSGPYLLYHFF